MTRPALVLAAFASCLSPVAPAAATTVSAPREFDLHGTVISSYVVRADPGEANTIDISSRGEGIVVHEQTASLKVESPCRLEDAQTAVCERTGVPVVEVSLLDLDDTLDATLLELPTQLDGGEGGDVVEGGPRHDLLKGGSGDDRLIGGGGTDVVSYDDQYDGGPVQIDLSDSNPDGRVGESDTITEIENIIGTSSRGDTLVGDDGANRISGQGGGDTMSGLRGDDHIDAFSGGEKVDAGPGDDVISGSLPPASRIVCGSGDDQLVSSKHRRIPADCERVHGLFSRFTAHPAAGRDAAVLGIRCLERSNCDFRVTITRRGGLVAVGKRFVKRNTFRRMRLRWTSRALRPGQAISIRIVLLDGDGNPTRDSRVTTTLATRS